MAKQALSTKNSVNKNKPEYIDNRRISLPMFSSDSDKDVPNYLRASIGSCHDYCKYGKETVYVRQIRPQVKKTAVESQVVFPTIKSTKIARKANPKIMLKEKKVSYKSNDKDIKNSAEFPTTSESRGLKKKSW